MIKRENVDAVKIVFLSLEIMQQKLRICLPHFPNDNSIFIVPSLQSKYSGATYNMMRHFRRQKVSYFVCKISLVAFFKYLTVFSGLGLKIVFKTKNVCNGTNKKRNVVEYISS